MIESLTSFGYVVSGVGFVLAVVAYFVLPKLIKSALQSDPDDSSPNEDV